MLCVGNLTKIVNLLKRGSRMLPHTVRSVLVEEKPFVHRFFVGKEILMMVHSISCLLEIATYIFDDLDRFMRCIGLCCYIIYSTTASKIM